MSEEPIRPELFKLYRVPLFFETFMIIKDGRKWVYDMASDHLKEIKDRCALHNFPHKNVRHSSIQTTSASSKMLGSD